MHESSGSQLPLPSSELPLEHKENQKTQSNQSYLMTFLTNLRVTGILFRFR